MATVYLAHDIRHDRDVAIKVLHPDLAAVLGRERFLNEIRLTARLDHPHILTLIDSGETDGFLWYVTPYIRGESLRHRLDREKQLGVEFALAVTKQIAGALGHAHDKGIIHRDIKPENILLHEGEAVLADFGIALAVKEAGGNRLTMTGMSIGTPQYMSPEQATGDRDLDARSDIYSLGAVLYEMLSGEPPFSGATAQAVIARLMTERPLRIRTVRDTVPEGIDAAVAKALAKVPADRFPGAQELVRALEIGVVPVKSRRRVLVPLLAVGGLGLAIGSAILLRTRLHRSATLPPVERRQLTFSGRATYPILSPDGRYVAYLERTDCGDSNRTAACPQDLVIQETVENGARRVLASIAGTQPLAWSPDSRELMVVNVERSGIAVSIVSAMNGATRFLSSTMASWGTSSDTVFTWSFAGKDGHPWIITHRAGDGTAVDSVAAAIAFRIFSVKVSPDGRWLLMTYQANPAARSQLAILDRRGMLRGSVSDFTEEVGWGSRSDRVYVLASYGSAETQLVRRNVNPETGEVYGQPHVVLKLAQFPRGVTIAGSTLAIGEGAPPVAEIWTLRRANPTSRWQQVRRVNESTAAGTIATLSRNGNTVLISTARPGADPSARQVSSMPFDGGPLTVWGTSRYWDAQSADRSADANEAVIAEPRNGHTWVSLYDPRTNVARQLGRAPTDSGDIAWLADGRFLWHPDLRPEMFLLSGQWQVEQHWSWGDSLVVSEIMPAPDGRAAAVRLSHVAGDSSIAQIARISLEDGSLTPFWTDTMRSPNFRVGQWTKDGWIHLHFLEPFPIHLIRIPVAGGAAISDTPLPLTGDYLSRVSYSDDALRAVVTVERRSYDVVLERDFDPAGKE